MELEFEDDELEALAYRASASTKRWPASVTEAYRRRIQQLSSATSEQDLRALKSLHLEELHGSRWPGCHSIRINNEYRLVIRFRTGPHGRVTVSIDGLDYH